jgi:hypothetical protein
MKGDISSAGQTEHRPLAAILFTNTASFTG